MTQPPRRNRPPGFTTRAIHHGYDPAQHQRAVGVPVYFTSTYGFESVAESESVAEAAGATYAREHNPTTALLEARLAELEGADAAVAVASGMAAVGTLMLSLLSAGDALVVHRTLYSNTYSQVHQALPRLGIRIIAADLSNPGNLDAALRDGPKLVYCETPVNPTAEVLDIAALAARAHAAGARLVVDSTFASPAVQRPIAHGADLVLHSLTKYINGHGDMLGGAVIGDAHTIATLRSTGLRYITGATLSPMAAFLALRGLKTLALRMDRHAATAQAIAELLAAHPAVAWVRYPGLASSPGHAAALRQMANGSGMMAFALKSGFEGARAFMDRLHLVTRAVSLGDAETLIMHPGGLTAARARSNPAARLAEGVEPEMMRLSVGLEDAQDLLDDLEQALDGA
jgi:methionine-gamma-lyase